MVGPRLGDVMGCLVGSPNRSELGYGLRRLIGNVFLSGPRICEVEGNLVRNSDSEVLGRFDGCFVGGAAKDFHSDHQTASGSGDV